MNKFLYILLPVLFLWLHPLEAQQDILYRHHHLHEHLSNPALTGNNYHPQAALSYQKQWLGIAQSPYTLLASANYRVGTYDYYNPKMMVNKSNLSSKERMGLGLGFFADQNGPLSSWGAKVAYAFHLPMNSASLGLGIALSLGQDQLNGTAWDPVSTDDPLLQAVKESWFSFNTDVGMVYTREALVAGFAINKLLPLPDSKDPGEMSKQDFIFHGAYMINDRDAVKLEPGLHLRYLEYSKLEFDLRLKAYIRHIHWVSLTYRSYQALSVAAGIRVGKQLYFAYQFESNLSSMISYSAGSHGIHLGINLGTRAWEGHF